MVPVHHPLPVPLGQLRVLQVRAAAQLEDERGEGGKRGEDFRGGQNRGQAIQGGTHGHTAVAEPHGATKQSTTLLGSRK
jgi:hypothetical protein